MKINSKLNIAIVHDTLTYLGGAERVLLNMLKMFPNADLHTSLLDKKYLGLIKGHSKGKVIYSKLSRVPFFIRNPELLKAYILFYWQRLNLSKYDLVISSSHSFSSNWVRVKGVHVSYIHTPPRYLYGIFNETRFLNLPAFKQLLQMLFWYIRKLDFKKVSQIRVLIANSENVRHRIQKFYKRDSIVIYPPIGRQFKKLPRVSRDYYLFFSRLVKQKGIRLAVEVFNKNGKKLVVVGTGKEFNWARNHALPNITFTGFVPDQKLPEIISGAKALIYCSIDEDFGMVPVEVMGYGIPVIAYKSGGVIESVVEGKTGLFFEKYSTNSLDKAIIKFEKTQFNSRDCIDQSGKFSEQIFKKKILKILNTHITK